MSFRDDRGSQDDKSASDPATPSKTRVKAGERRTRRRAPGGEVGNALRTVYDDTLKESIPPEMLDLLGKLG
ncbi:MAG: Anti-sigma factor NepR [Sphingomonadales bacterium]|nr:Anti-sigma factor NepR [Sphingomonadales bacterium]